jgi:modulator of FtsH protease
VLLGAAGADRLRDRRHLRAHPEQRLIYAIAGLVIFAGFTMYDFQRLRKTKDIRAAPLLAASIFLDVLNVFLLLLSLFNRR